jgi:hypothetical protein
MASIDRRGDVADSRRVLASCSALRTCARGEQTGREVREVDEDQAAAVLVIPGQMVAEDLVAAAQAASVRHVDFLSSARPPGPLPLGGPGSWSAR